MPSVNLNDKKQLDHPVKSGNHGYSLKTSEKVETLGDDMPRNSVKHSKSPTMSNIFVAFRHINFQPLWWSQFHVSDLGRPAEVSRPSLFSAMSLMGIPQFFGSVVKLSEIAAKTSGNDLVTRSPFQTLEAWQSVSFQSKQAGVAVPNFSCRQQYCASMIDSC